MLPPSLQDSLPAGWLAFAGRASTLWIATKGFRSQSHPPFLDLSWRKGSFMTFPQTCPADTRKKRQSREQLCAQPIWPRNDTKGESSSFVNDRGNADLPTVIRFEII